MEHDNSMVSRGEFNHVIDQVSERLHEMVDNQRDIQKSIQDMLLLARMTQTAQMTTDKKINEEISPKVNKLWDNRSEFKGGYILISILGGIIVGGASVALVIVEVMKR
jgi:hypothetical protein